MKIIIKSLPYLSLLLVLIMTAWEIPAQGQFLTAKQVSAKLELGQFYFKAEPARLPFEAIGQNIDRKIINLDEDNQEEIIILRRLPNDKIILEISDGAGRFRWSEGLAKEVSGTEEIGDIADINGDGRLEIVVEETNPDADKHLEIFTYNRHSSKKIFSAKGFDAWSIQGAGKEIIIEEIPQASYKSSQDKVYLWRNGQYKLVKELKV